MIRGFGKLNDTDLSFTVTVSLDAVGRFHFLLKEDDISSMEISFSCTGTELVAATHWIQSSGDPQAVPVFEEMTRDQREAEKIRKFAEMYCMPGETFDTAVKRAVAAMVNPCKEMPPSAVVPDKIDGQWTVRALDSCTKYLRIGETLKQCADRVYKQLVSDSGDWVPAFELAGLSQRDYISAQAAIEHWVHGEVAYCPNQAVTDYVEHWIRTTMASGSYYKIPDQTVFDKSVPLGDVGTQFVRADKYTLVDGQMRHRAIQATCIKPSEQEIATHQVLNKTNQYIGIDPEFQDKKSFYIKKIDKGE